ncbi:hypothetical protein Tco_0920800, partial [Tanacetum coccineum]
MCDQFLEFPLPCRWAPAYGDLSACSSMQEKPNPISSVHLLRCILRIDRHWVPKMLELSDDFGNKPNDEPIGKRLSYLMILVIIDVFSHVCTMPVDYNETRINDSPFIVTKAWFKVKGVGMKRVIFLRLGYSTVRPIKIRRFVSSPKGLLQLASSLTEEKTARTKHIN